MTKEQLQHYLADLRCLTLFPKRYDAPQGRTKEYWSAIMRDYSNEQKRLRSTDYRWYIISFDDGRRELAYLKVRAGGLLTGKYPAIYRGILIPRMLRYETYAHITKIRLAF